MTRTGVERQLRTFDEPGQLPVVADGVEGILCAVRHQRRHLDRGHLAPRSVGSCEPLEDGGPLRGLNIWRHRVEIRVPQDAERVQLGCRARARWEEHAQDDAGVVTTGSVRSSCAGNCRVAGPRLSRGQHEPADLRWVEHGKGLGDHPSHGPTEHGGRAQVESRDQGARLVSHAGDGERRGNGGRLAYAGVVEDNDLVARRQGIDERRRPVVHGPAEAHDEQQCRPAA